MIAIGIVESIDSDELSDMFCEHCDKNGKSNVPAVGFCVNCVTYYCQTCLNYHTSFLPDHTHQDYDDMPKEFCFEKCEHHSSEIVKFYCQTCEAFACTACKRSGHKECDSLHHIPSLLDQFEENKELESFERKIERVEKKVTDTKSIIEQKYEHVRQCKEKVKSVIKEYRNDINKMFDELENEAETEIDKIEAEDQANLSLSSEKLSELETKLEAIKSESLCSKRTCQRCKILMMVKRTKNDLDFINGSLENLSNETQVHDFSYEQSGIIKSTTDFGTLNINQSMRKNPQTEYASAVSKRITSKVAHFRGGFKLVSTIVIPILAIIVVLPFLVSTDSELVAEADEPILLGNDGEDRRDNLIPDICHFQQHFIITTMPNKHLLLLISTKDKRIVSQFSTQNAPIFVTKVGENVVAVMFKNSVQVQFIQIDNLQNAEAISWSLIKRIDLASGPGPICSINNNLYMYNVFEHKIIMMDFNGNIIKEMSVKENDGGVIVCYNETAILCTSMLKKAVDILDTSSGAEVKTLYTHKDLAEPFGMTVDNKGNVYICGHKSNNIHVLFKNLSIGKILLNETHGIQSPVAIAFSDKENKLFVSSELSNEIAVFKLK